MPPGSRHAALDEVLARPSDAQGCYWSIALTHTNYTWWIAMAATAASAVGIGRFTLFGHISVRKLKSPS